MTWLTTLATTLALLMTAIVSSVPPASAAVTVSKTAGHAAGGTASRPVNTVAKPDVMADIASARRQHARIEVATDRTAFSQTYANPDGTLTTVESAKPRLVARGGSWVAADADLVRGSGGWWSPKAAEAGLRLSGGGTRVLATLGSVPRAMSVSWPSALPAPRVTGATATYASVFPGVDLIVTADVTGAFAETLVVHDAAAAADPRLRNLTLGTALSAGLSQRVARNGTVTVQTSAGQAVFSSPAPAAWDSAHPAGSRSVSTVAGPARGAHVAKVPASYSAGAVRMSVPAGLLSGPSTVYPVYVDPSYSESQYWEGYGEIQSEYPTANELNNTFNGQVSVGNDSGGVDRGDYVLGLPSLPIGLTATVQSATFTDEVVSTYESTSQSHTINLYGTNQYTSATTWDNPTTQIAGPVAATFTTTSTTPDQNVSWNVTSWMQTALNSTFQLSTELINSDETDTSQFVAFGQNPTLTYTYSQPAPSIPVGVGPLKNATQLSFPISDKVSLQVNVGSGNALVTTSDITLPEQGTSLTLGAAYNSLLNSSQVQVGSDGTAWRQREGADVRLYLGSDGSLTYLGEDGTAGKFTASGSSFTSPPQFHVTLTTSSGSTCGGTGYTMTWHSTGEVMCFNVNGLLTSEADRNGNTTAYSYNGNNEETQITYTPKGGSSPVQTVTATYTGASLTGLSQSGGSLGTRSVSYSINSNGDLASVTQADNTTINFGYDSSHDLTSIENGDSTTTQIGYNSSHQVTSVSQPYSSCGCTATTRLSYVSSTETQVADPNTNQSDPVSSVPNVTYTVNSSTSLVTKTVDQASDSRSANYNTTFNNLTSAINGENGTTTNTYGANSGESLTASQSPTGATSSLAYGNSNSGTNPTAAFQPSASTDAQKNKTAYTYDGAGNVLQSASALPATAKVTYNSDGTPATSTDPKNGSNSTSYSYNSSHQLTKITPPTGSSLQAETISYDGFGRISTITDGDGNTLTYTYDLADRITQQAYTGGAHPVTVTYAYDGAGNLKTQTDPSGTTSYTYDGGDRVLTKDATSGGGSLSYSYDADGNLTQAGDAGGTTKYSYDNRNLLSSLTDPAGNLWQFASNADGLRTTTWFATNSGNTSWAEKMITSYDSADRITRIQSYRNSSTSNVVSDVSYCYTAYVSGKSCPTTSATTDTSLVQYSVNNQTSTVSQYAYDTGDRLTSITNDGGKTYSYGYDTDGNVTSGANKGSETYNSANQITSTGYTYDGAGNLTATPGNGTSAFNDAEQWTGASNAGGNGAESFTYAGAGQDQVLSDGSASGITYGLAGQAGQPWVQSYTPAGSAADYVIHDQRGTPLGYVQSGTAYAFVTDNIGSVTNVVGSNGTTEATYAYDPYGHVNSATGTDAAQNLIRYAGALYDTSSNYWHFGSRWYNPTTTGFTSQDTNSYIDNPGNGNRYAYASDNPANYVDPAGHCSASSIVGDATTLLTGGGTAVGTWILAGVTFVPFTAGIILLGVGVLGALGGAAALGLCLAGS